MLTFLLTLYHLGGPTSPELLKVDLRPIPIEQCKYSYPPSLNPRINLGILEDQMICAGDFKDGNDTCTVRKQSVKCSYLNSFTRETFK